MKRFLPVRAYFEPQALKYDLGEKIYETLRNLGVPIYITGSHNKIIGLPGKSAGEAYREAKRTLVVGVKKSLDFAACKPSAHYQLPLNTSCPGMCEYCYLATTLGRRPYLRVYVNIEEILAQAAIYIKDRAPEITLFEGAATSDPVPTEYLTGLLRKTIEFFSQQEFGMFRFVTKHDDVDSLLDVKHNGHTRFRFSLNAQVIISDFEHATPSLEERMAAAAKVAKAGYPLGFIIAPIFHFPKWRQHYTQFFDSLDSALPQAARENITFELITHRFTSKAKSNIAAIFPHSKLPLDEDERKYKYGQFGYGKYIYDKPEMEEMKLFFSDQLSERFPKASIDYFI